MKIFDCVEGERLIIDNQIILTVVEVTSDEVCLKIDLPEGTEMCVEDVHHYAI